MESANVVNASNSHAPNQNPIQEDPVSKAIQNAIILDRISSYVSTVDMKNCRSANKLWKNEWTSVIHKRSEYQLCLTKIIDLLVKELRTGLKELPNSDWNKRAQEYFYSMNRNDVHTRAKSIVLWITENIQNFPCSKIRVGTETFKFVNRFAQSKFLRAISGFVTELVLETAIVDPPFRFENWKTYEFCNLKALEISCCSDVHCDMALKFFGQITQLAPKLDTIRLIDLFGKFLSNYITLICNPKQIKSLHVKGTITENELGKLVEKKFSLHEFGVCFEYLSSFSSQTFESFLSSQRNSLKKLYLKCKVLKFNNQITFPQIPTLAILEIDCNSRSLDFPEICLHRSFPELKCFKIINIEPKPPSFLNEDMQPIKTVEEFEMRLMYTTRVLQCCRIFPNLKKLSIHCQLFWVLKLNAATMKSLKELTLWCHWEERQHMLNEILTGYSKEDFVAAEKWGGFLGVQKQPMKFLHSVKTLRLVNGGLTDLICKHGPMKLKSLQCLDLRINKLPTKCKISKEMLEKMRVKFAVLLMDECVI